MFSQNVEEENKGQHFIVSLPHRQIVTLTNTFAKIIS